MNPDQIDYQPLEGMNHLWLTTCKYLLFSKRVGWLVLAAIISAAGILLSSTQLIGFPLIIYFGFVILTHIDLKNNTWKRFAEVNHWRYTDAGGDLPQSLRFNSKTKYEFSPGVEIPIGNGLICQLFLCGCQVEYVGGDRVGISTARSFTVGSIVLPWSLPHIMLRSKADKIKDRPEIANATSLQLEGTFNQHFDLQIEQGQQIDALTVLTPDIMQALITYNAQEDIEIHDKLLSFIIAGEKGNIGDVKMLVRSAFELGNQIAENIRLAKAPAPSEAVDSGAGTPTLNATTQ